MYEFRLPHPASEAVESTDREASFRIETQCKGHAKTEGADDTVEGCAIKGIIELVKHCDN